MSDEGYCGVLHGCATGDCSHRDVTQCLTALVSELEVADGLIATLRAKIERQDAALERLSERAEAAESAVDVLEKEAATLRAEVARLSAGLEEREADMHLRIRAGYDKTVADAWREKVDALTAQLAAERERVDAILDSFENPKDPAGMHIGAIHPPPSMRFWVRKMRAAIRALPAPEAT